MAVTNAKLAKDLERTNALEHAKSQLEKAKAGSTIRDIEAAMYWREVIVRILGR